MGLFDAVSLLAHEQRPLWDVALRWLSALSDTIIALAYYSIPVAMVVVLIRRKDMTFRWIFFLCAAFLLACGTMHMIGVWIIWHPMYRLEGAVKAATACLSIVTAIMLWRVLPLALTLPSRRQLQELNRTLQVQIREREAAEQALRQSDERFHAFMAHSPAVAFIKDEAGRFAYFNDSAPITRQLLDGRPWQGKTDKDLWPQEAARLRMHDHDVFQANTVKETREQLSVHGTLRDWVVYKFPFHDHNAHRFIGGMAIDETARRQAERALEATHDELETRVEQRTHELLTVNQSLERSESRYRALVQASSQIVWARDADGISVDPADSWCRFTGQRPEEAKRLGWLDAVHPDDRERTRRLWLQAVREKTEYVNEYQLRRADGAYRWMSIRGVPIVDQAGSVREWIGMNTDITEAKQASLALRQALHDVKEKQGQLVQAGKLASLGELTTGIAHELNNPLNNISLYIGNVVECWAERGQHAADRQITQLKAALHEVQRAATIITHLRTFGRQAGTQRERLSVNEVVQSAVELVRHQLRLQTIAIHIDLDPEEPVLQANRLQLEQVLVNLLTNARDAVNETILKEIHLRTVSRVDRVEIRVSDSGSGIDPEIQSRIFDPFFTTKEVGQGTGLGLSISYGIIKDHGGEIHVMSGLGQGTTFLLQLPIGTSASDIARNTVSTLVAP